MLIQLASAFVPLVSKEKDANKRVAATGSHAIKQRGQNIPRKNRLMNVNYR